ncbi:Predicted dehydrogenase [Faunimonas pinastri]|uniref:Predicted dehydrogenase n=1 Tax=Faunimonas pinastri TaxID=1855383 RepID=A0A1H9APJ9_9HYPH|nr:Gfo/Idh/MocA family oxidoreductase [Faunimonas pinastri]SEP78640.1 Predicted dehydrogenase [Faunimonas pinastri]
MSENRSNDPRHERAGDPDGARGGDHGGNLSRRSLLQAGGIGVAGLAAASAMAVADAQTVLPAQTDVQVSPPVKTASLPGPNPIDLGKVEGNKVSFTSLQDASEGESSPPSALLPPDRRVGFAIVGLGHLAVQQILPGFGSSRKAKPVALVSGRADKARVIASQYGIKPEAVYDYESFDRIAQNPDVKVVYIVLPNAMHKEFVIRAAKAGKHVLCEKPMATSSSDCREMIDACDKAGVKLMIAYRCQYEPHHRYLMDSVRKKDFGEMRLVRAVNGQDVGAIDQWRLRKALSGGGSLPDVGIYCLNAARYITGEEPVEVFAQISTPPNDPRFKEVEESVSFQLRFPSGVLAELSCSYGVHRAQTLEVHTAEAHYLMEHAFPYKGQRLQISHKIGKSDADVVPNIEQQDQFALEMDHFATCVMENRVPRTPGEEGLQDQMLVEAIYQSARTGQAVKLKPVSGTDVTRGPMPENGAG